MSNIAISIIVPVFKVERFIRRCLNSIINQTFTDWECILVDDGSPDSSGEICDEYAVVDNRFRVFHKENTGVSNTRQFGLDRANGDYVIHMDPDDWATSDMLEALYDVAIAEDADMVICDFYKDISQETIYCKQELKSVDPESVFSDLFDGLYGSCWNKLIRRSTICENKVSFPNNWNLCEDHYFVARFLTYDVKISYLGRAFYHYVVGQNQNSITLNITSTNYDYDVMLYTTFSCMTKGHNCHRKATSIYAYQIVKNEFFRHESSPRAFIHKCSRYMGEMLLFPFPLKLKMLLILSCVGGYNIAYYCWKTNHLRCSR